MREEKNVEMTDLEKQTQLYSNHIKEDFQSAIYSEEQDHIFLLNQMNTDLKISKIDIVKKY